MFKEDLIPNHVDKPLYVLAPAMLLVPALITVAVVPFGSSITLFGYEIPLHIADINIGILYVLAITSLGVYGVVLGAWASNNKYSLLGGLRSSAQMISYELTLGLAIIGVLMLTSSLSLRAIAVEQGAYPWQWNFLIHLPAFLAFTTAMFAETNRLPFDLAEAEQETRRWVSHRIQQYEIRYVFHGRIYEHDCRLRCDSDPLLGGLALLRLGKCRRPLYGAD